MYNILIIYYCTNYPVRTTIFDHLYSFRRHSSQCYFYVNIYNQNIPEYLLKIPFDLIIFHTTFLSQRAWNVANFHRIAKKTQMVKQMKAVKVALPQDEFLNTDLLCDFINEYNIQHVFSVMPKAEWSNIYHNVDWSFTKFHQVLTGYLEDVTLSRIEDLARTITNKDIDIGYRAYGIRHWLGRHGYLKIQIAKIFQDRAYKVGLNLDISTKSEDTFLGDEWYKFLLRCKYTIGIEGGASILDRDGSIKKRTEEYLRQHPLADFQEVESNCFLGLDNKVSLFALSPRHLEACATKTCQVLIEGEYNGILEPNKHYIPLKKDFSNIDEVVEKIQQDKLRNAIVESAFRDIILSRQYTNKRFVDFVLNKSLENTSRVFSTTKIRFIVKWSQIIDWVSWRKIQSSQIIRGLISKSPSRIQIAVRLFYSKFKTYI